MKKEKRKKLSKLKDEIMPGLIALSFDYLLKAAKARSTNNSTIEKEHKQQKQQG